MSRLLTNQTRGCNNNLTTLTNQTRRCNINNNCSPTIAPQTAICQKDCDPILQLTSSITAPAVADLSAISPDGTQVLSLLSFFFGEVSAVPIDFQLYNNNCGVLTPTLTRLPLPNATVSLAAVSVDFTTAVGLYENTDAQGNSLGTGFLSVFNPSNPSVTLKTIPLILPPGFTSFVGFSSNTSYLGGISDDNRFVTVNFLTSSFPNSQGFLQVYDIVTGTKVAETPIIGFSNGGYFFDLCQKIHKEGKVKSSRKHQKSESESSEESKRKHRKHRRHQKSKCNRCEEPDCIRRRFIAIGSATADVSANAQACSGLQILAPAIFQIFELKCNALVEVARTSVSGLVSTISIPRGICCPPEILIAINAGGEVPGAPSFYSFPDPVARNSLNGQPGGVTIFRFNGERLCQVAFQPDELAGASAVSFSADGKLLAIAFSTSVRAPFSFCNLCDVVGLPPLPSVCPLPADPTLFNNLPQVRFTFPGYFQVFRVVNQPQDNKKLCEKCNDGCDCSVCLYPVDIPRATAPSIFTLPFSLNGRWLIVSGAIINRPSVPVNANGAPFPIPVTGPINNVQLYRVILPDCCPYPDEEDPIECIKQNTCDNLENACDSTECVPFQLNNCSQQNICNRQQNNSYLRENRYYHQQNQYYR